MRDYSIDIAPPPVSPSERQRQCGIDLLRFGAAVGIVVFHAGAPGALIGYAALPMFLALLVHLERTYTPPLRRRAARLLTPWLAWSALYAGLKSAEALTLGTPLGAEFAWPMLLYGPVQHLWFLPYAFAAGALLRAVPAPEGKAAFRGALALLPAIWLGTALVDAGALPTPLGEWMVGLPALWIGVLLGPALARPGRAGALALVILGTGAAGPALGLAQGALHYTVSGLVLLAALARPLPGRAWMRGLGDLALGIYLMHPLAILGLDALGIAMGTLANAAAATLVSALGAALARRLPLLRRVV